jgi:hypothetical protein
VRVKSDDHSLPPTSIVANWGPTFLGCASRAGRPLDTQLTMRASIEEAGGEEVKEEGEKGGKSKINASKADD